MKKMIAVTALCLITFASFAQIQRQKKEVAKPDSSAGAAVQTKDEGPGRKEMMKELDLSKEQKLKIKAFRQDAKAKKDAIENDTTLKPEEKQARLKELRKELEQNTISVLSREQKMKLLKMRSEKKGKPMDALDNQ